MGGGVGYEDDAQTKVEPLRPNRKGAQSRPLRAVAVQKRSSLKADLNDLEPDVKTGLDCLLGHISMLCKLDGALHEKFILDFFAHLVQFPNVKFGVMLCFIGKQGLGKQHLWDAIHRMVGKHACFETGEPQRDVWGDNNDNMRSAFMVRIVESDDKMFAGQIGKVRNMITDPQVRVRSLYGSASNVASYTRYVADTNVTL